MADTRLPEKWLSDRRVRRLTDRGFRAFITTLMWSVSNQTDGIIEPEDLSLIPGFPTCGEDELAASTLWEPIEHGWYITVYADTQTSKAEFEALAKARQANKERQAKWRAERGNNVTSNVTKPVTAQARLGKARLGALPSIAPKKDAGARDGCDLCDDTGWQLDEKDCAVRCTCRPVRAVQ